MFAYDFERLNYVMKDVLEKSVSSDAWKWLTNEAEMARSATNSGKFNIAFVAMPRKTGKNPIHISDQEISEIRIAREHFEVTDWTADRLARVWLLMQLDPGVKEKYIATIENLFLNGEMSELVALYSALPTLAYPDAWKKRCAEGIRNNIGQVLDAVICKNPFPSEKLDEPAWNQLVLKAIFTEKPVLDIVGLKERRNRALARSLSDYAHERWAAGREVNPLLWICVAPFIDESNISDLRRIASSNNPLEREAAALACYESDYAPARELVRNELQMESDIEEGKLTWQQVASKSQEGVNT